MSDAVTKESKEVGDETEALTVLSRWCDSVDSFTLPKWKDLPEIDLYMDQVTVLLAKYLGCFIPDAEKQITASMINNYVKLDVIPPPVKKKYGRDHMAYLIMVFLLKQSLSISEISVLLRDRTQVDPIGTILDSVSESYVAYFKRSVKGIKQKLRNECTEAVEEGGSCDGDEVQNRRVINDIILEQALQAGSSQLIAENILKCSL